MALVPSLRQQERRRIWQVPWRQISTLPVIGIPIKSSTLDGLDALLSTVQMPGGLPVATVAIDGAENAALLAIQILAVEEATLAEKLDNARKEAAEKVLAKNKALEEKYAK